MADARASIGILQAPAPEAGAAPEPEGGFDVGLFLVLLAVVALVCLQNVWLRRRADRENAAAKREES